MSPRSHRFVSRRFERGAVLGRGTRDAGKLLQSAYSPTQETTGERLGGLVAARLLHSEFSCIVSVTDHNSR